MAAWDFAEGGEDRVGHADVALQGGASLSAEGLVLDGKSAYAITPPLGIELKEKTLEAWVRLEGTDQRGGGVLSVLEESGPFDAIVFGEVEPRPLDGRQRELRQDVGRGRGRRGRSRKAVRPRRHPLFAPTGRSSSSATAGRTGRRIRPRVRSSSRRGGAGWRSASGIFPPAATGCCAGRSRGPGCMTGAGRRRGCSLGEVRGDDPRLRGRDRCPGCGGPGDSRAARRGGERLKAGLSADRHKAYAVAPRPAGVTSDPDPGNPGQPGEAVAAGGSAP